MRIVIEVRDTATLTRIEQFANVLSEYHVIGSSFIDVIKTISVER